MPKHTTYMLRWSEERQSYEMTGGLPDTELPQPTSPEWLAWLSGLGSFAFVCRSGTHYTARKEKLQRGGVYWYSYRSHLGKTIKRYIGKPTDLSIDRLEEVATHLMSTNLPPSSAQSLPAQMKNGTAESKALAVRHAPTLSLREKDTTIEPLTMPLLIAKLHPPHLPAALVARPDVMARLDAGMAYKLTLLSTPAGFGKTTAVSQWLAARTAPIALTEPQIPAEATPHPTTFYQDTAWVALDEGDNDPARFWRYIIAACQSFQADLGRSALALLFSALQPPFEQPSQEMMLTVLLNDITQHVSNGLLILDDYHVITEPRIHAMLTFFIDHLPASLHVIFLTRSEPPLPLVRWRARGELHDIHTADLRFSHAETATFLQQAGSSVLKERLSDEAIGHVARGMDGWAAGLRLFLLTLPRQAERGELERHLALLANSPARLNGHPPTHPPRAIVEYFIAEVLNAQPQPLQHFLLQTSILSRLTGSLCDTVTGRQDCVTLLEVVERAGLFLEALEGAGQVEQWYRYHTLFAEAMHREAQVRLGEEQLRVLAQSASHWYEQHGLLAEAVEAALSAQEFDRAALLIERIYKTESFYEMHTLLHWLGQVPETVLMQHPELSFYEAHALLFTFAENETIPLKIGRLNERLQIAEEHWRASEDRARLGEVFAFRTMVTWWQGEIRKAGEYARQALDLLPITPTQRSEKIEWHSICLAIIGLEIMSEGNLDEARQMLQEALENISGKRNFTRALTMMLSSILLLQGELSQATEYIQQVLSEARAEQDWSDMAPALHGLMGIAYERNDLTTLEHWANEVAEMDAQPLKGEWRAMLQLYPALLHHLRGETKKAQQQLTALLVRMELIQSPTSLLFDVQSWQVRLHLASGDLPAAQRSLLALSRHRQDISPLYQERWQLLQARLLLARGEAQVALLQLESLLAIVRAKQRTREALEIQVQMVLAYAACKQGQEARHLLQQTLVQAQSENYLRLFLDEGESLALLLRSLLPTLQEKMLRTYVQHLLQLFHATALEANPQITSAPLPIEPLSKQELRVLRLLSAGQTNPQMARELVVSVNTIKDHVKNLYRKLQVSSRLEASEAARRIKLL
jgi:LuxR family maltose regulon positive regulatory protein